MFFVVFHKVFLGDIGSTPIRAAKYGSVD